MLKLCRTCFAFAVVLPCAAFAEDGADAIFKALDSNNDGKIAADEVRPERKAAFERLLRVGDQNKDGVLTRAEFDRGLQEPKLVDANPAGGRPGAARGGRAGGGGQFFNFLDKNKDGKLTLDELPEQAKTRLKPLFERLGKDSISKEEFSKLRRGQPGGGGQNQRVPVGELFDRFDKDKDGKIKLADVPEQIQGRLKPLFDKLGKDVITREEATKFAQQLADRRPNPDQRKPAPRDARSSDRPGTPNAGDRPGQPRLPVIFRKLDANQDGKISKQELEDAGKYFAELDRNNDGVIDPPELFGARQQGRPGQGRPGQGRPGQGRPNPGQPAGQPRATDRPQGANQFEAFFKRLDKNNDGKISREEAPARMKERFDQLDANDDGAVSMDEFRKAGQRLNPNGGRPNRAKSPQRKSRPAPE